MEDNEWRQSGLPGEEHRDGPGGGLYINVSIFVLKGFIYAGS